MSTKIETVELALPCCGATIERTVTFVDGAIKRIQSPPGRCKHCDHTFDPAELEAIRYNLHEAVRETPIPVEPPDDDSIPDRFIMKHPDREIRKKEEE